MVQNNAAQELGELLRRFAGIIMKQSTGDMLRIMRREELSMPQVVSLFFLRHTEAASVSLISEHLNLSLAATSHLIDRLVVGTYVSRTESSVDRRHKEIALTDKGRALVSELEQARQSLVTHRLNELPPEVVRSAADALRNVLTHLEESKQSSDAPPFKRN